MKRKNAPPVMGQVQAPKAVKKEKQPERWAAEPSDQKMVEDVIQPLGIKGKELTTVAAHTYDVIRVGNFSNRALTTILETKMGRIGLTVDSDHVAAVVSEIADWGKKLAKYKLDE